ncbi:hypothetical protein ACFLYB_03650 [Chloroflexota bacterium]
MMENLDKILREEEHKQMARGDKLQPDTLQTIDDSTETTDIEKSIGIEKIQPLKKTTFIVGDYELDDDDYIGWLCATHDL